MVRQVGIADGKAGSEPEAGVDQPGAPEDLAVVFRALGDPTRLAIFELIREAGQGAHTAADIDSSVTWIANHFDVSLSTVSHHLKELRRARLVRCERRGQQILCSVDPAAFAKVRQFLDKGEAR